MQARSLLVSLMFCAAIGRPTFAQTSQPAFPYGADVTADDVYVRSGPGSNYYPTTKLHAGDRVQVVGEQFGWLKIAPPPGSFSYVDMTLIEKTGANDGAVKGDNVRVRAGSLLSAQKREVQSLLKKGTRVQILGEADGMYKIAPPDGAHLWISGQFVGTYKPPTSQAAIAKRTPPKPAAPPAAARPGATELAAGAAPAKPLIDAAGGTTLPTPGGATGAPGAPASTAMPGSTGATGDATKLADAGPGKPIIPPTNEKSPASNQPVIPKPQAPGDGGAARMTSLTKPTETAPADPKSGGKPGSTTVTVNESEDAYVARLRSLMTTPGPFGAQLIELEGGLRQSLAQVVLNKSELLNLLQRYQPIAAQQDEPIAEAIAQARVKQLQDRISLLDARDRIASDVQDLNAFRAQLGEDRKRIVTRIPGQQRDYDFRGELRPSQVFDAASNRLRLVDPASGRTLAYVDIPASMDANVSGLIGQYVGVRAATRTFDTKLRVSVVEAEQITPLTAGDKAAQVAQPSADPDYAEPGF